MKRFAYLSVLLLVPACSTAVSGADDDDGVTDEAAFTGRECVPQAEAALRALMNKNRFAFTSVAHDYSTPGYHGTFKVYFNVQAPGFADVVTRTTVDHLRGYVRVRSTTCVPAESNVKRDVHQLDAQGGERPDARTRILFESP